MRTWRVVVLLARYDQQGNVDRALARFQLAIEGDPNYALAYAGLAEAYFRKMVNTSDSQWLERAAESAQRAAALAPRLPMAYVVLGEINVYQGRHQEAIQQFERGIANRARKCGSETWHRGSA
ncbi:MAG: tetratricopeptide repeat protein, partial [Rhodospirillales bacterium]|nr:tetratricopeptide repeat protein [Rhodospirillales bacterium]